MNRLVGALLVAFATIVPAAEWVPGEEVRWAGLGEETPLRLFVPADYDPGRAWPLIYLFHGTGGRASTGLIQRYTNGGDFILVGAPYAEPGQGSLSRQGVLKEIRRIGRVRELLDDSLNLDGRTYVGGFSKGGWMADLLTTEGFPTLAGALILGAGRIPADVGRALERNSVNDEAKPLAIYIGIGQSDTNHPYSRRAAAHYRQRGCDTVFEEYLAKAHQPGESDTIYLTQWLRLQTNDAAVKTEAMSWWKARLAASKTITHASDRLWFLTHALRSPFATIVPEAERQALKQTLQRVRSHRSLRDEIDAESAYLKALTAEESFRRSDELPKVAGSFARIAERFPQSHHGQRAALDVHRISQNYKTLRRSGTQDQGVHATFPTTKANPSALRKRFATFSRLLRSPSSALPQD